jgi:putative toxin-antitoxin system antitoxin component (TIGR02293 family)
VTSPNVVPRLIPVIAHPIAVFGDEQKATHWLSTPLPLLENRAPADLLATDEGLELVERTLTRIEHNIPS